MSSTTLPAVQKNAWLPAVGPFVLFLILTSIEPHVGAFYPWFYTLKIVLVTAWLIALRKQMPEARYRASGQVLATIAGVVLLFAWIGIDHYTPHFSWMGGRVGYDPFAHIQGGIGQIGFLAVRFFGLVVVVPIIEEMFYRNFLLRYLTKPENWQQVPLGTFSLSAFVGANVLFASSHPEWLAALVFGMAMTGLVWRTKNLSTCITAHSVTNLLLGLYVLQTHQWHFW